MKTLKKQIEDEFNRPSGNEDNIMQLRRMILKLAHSIDNINEFSKFE